MSDLYVRGDCDGEDIVPLPWIIMVITLSLVHKEAIVTTEKPFFQGCARTNCKDRLSTWNRIMSALYGRG